MCEAALEEHRDRIKVMQEHLRNVQVRAGSQQGALEETS